MTSKELAHYDGRKGRPAYVAVGGIVYDLSTSPLWQEGCHENLHQAGCDLSEALKGAPHIAAVVERFPSVARLEEKLDPEPRGRGKLYLALLALALFGMLWLSRG